MVYNYHKGFQLLHIIFSGQRFCNGPFAGCARLHSIVQKLW